MGGLVIIFFSLCLIYFTPNPTNMLLRVHSHVSLFKRECWASNAIYRGSAADFLALQGFCANPGIPPQMPQKGDFFFFFFHLTYSRWTSSLPSCLWSQRIFPSLPGSRLTIFLSRCKFSTVTTRQPVVEFYLLTFPRFPLRRKEHKSYFGKNRTHDFRTSRCAAYLLDHSGDEQHIFSRLSSA